MRKPDHSLETLADWTNWGDSSWRPDVFEDLVRHVARLEEKIASGDEMQRSRAGGAISDLRERLDAEHLSRLEQFNQLYGKIDRVRESYGNQEPRSPLTPAEGSGSVGIVDPGAAEPVLALCVAGKRLDALLAAVDSYLNRPVLRADGRNRQTVRAWAMADMDRSIEERIRKAREAFR